MQHVPRLTAEWTGDVWKAWVRFMSDNPTSCTITDDYGIGIYNAGLPELSNGDIPEKLSWNWFEKNNRTHFNLMDAAELFDMLEYAKL